MSQADEQDPDADDATRDPRPVAQNPKRGCGHLKYSKSYVRSSPAAMDLPAFVEVEPRLPFREGHFRGYKLFPGYQFEMAVMDRVDFSPRSMVKHDFGRLFGEARGDHIGEMDVARSHDLLMWVGKSHYDPDEFIEEVRKLGLSKAIPVSKNQEPPTVKAGWTRVWCLHMEAIDGERPGLLGYAPAGEVVRTVDEDGGVPKWAQDLEAAGDLVVAKVGDEVSAEATTNHALGDYEGIEVPPAKGGEEPRNKKLREVAQENGGGGGDTESVRVVPSDKPGRDVEPAADADANGGGGDA